MTWSSPAIAESRERRSWVDVTQPASEPPRRLGALPLLAILALALVPRIIEALRTPLLFDELYTLRVARLGPAGVFRVLATDVDQPLGFLVVWATRAIGGEGYLWLKLPWLVFGTLTVLAVILIGRALFDARAALWAGAILAVNPTHIFYSEQAWYPALVWMLLTFALGFAWRWIAYDERRDALGFIVCAWLSAMAYYFSVFVIFAIVLWGFVRVRRDPPRVRAWLGVLAGCFLTWAPGIPLLLSQIRRDVWDDRFFKPMPLSDLLDLGRKLNDNSMLLLLPVAIVALLPLRRASQWRNASLLWIAIVLPVLVTFQMSNEGIHLFILKQWLYAIPFWALLIGAGLSRLRWTAVRLVLGAVIVLLGLRAWVARGPWEEARLMTTVETALTDNARPQDLVACGEIHTLFYLRHHLPRFTRVRLMTADAEVPFHYSDGVLAVTPEESMSESEWRSAIAGGARWWGVRLEHSGHDGPRAAAAFDGAARGWVRRYGKATLWEGAPGDSTAR